MPKKTRLSDMNEHLFDMAERLLNDEDVCVDAETTDREIKKAGALVNIANAVATIHQTEVQKAETEIKMFRVAEELGKTYVPEKIVNQEKCRAIESKKKLLTAQIN